MLSMGWISLYSLLFWHMETTLAALINVTVDDQQKDPQGGNLLAYTGDWQTGQLCDTSCGPLPDLHKANGATWSGATYNAGPGLESFPEQVTFTFNGMQSDYLRLSLN